ncbi:uncharacterized protein B0P05DRAFT_550827 [Gilbertella persicaria]|uniref:uncharacterized protein n=1 Tax=Gilbertella persicaria TaxID=101096 RepID=UPI00221EC5DE|nr:uncharacterized protein B0P05DRAFT_550827 [Gilbertella persicaria]KAI8069775.1 hypothetical protein B0P05DRAFT_550827 [Gilbertella persicaria]
MSEAKVFTSVQNVRSTTANQTKKTVFKHVLASPFILKWPTIHTDLGQTILSQLLKTLEPIGAYRNQCRQIKKEKKPDQIIAPELNQRLYVGINQVTRYMEKYIQDNPVESDKTPVIYICKREIKPLQLCQHVLYMAAVAKIKLVPMPAQAEARIGKALGMHRASVVLIEIMENKEESLRLSAKEIPLVDAPWLENALNRPVNYIGDTTKTLKTTAPDKKQQQQLKRKADTENGSTNQLKKVKQN